MQITKEITGGQLANSEQPKQFPAEKLFVETTFITREDFLSDLHKTCKPKHNLEDYEPGSSRSEVLGTLGKYAKATKPLLKHT